MVPGWDQVASGRPGRAGEAGHLGHFGIGATLRKLRDDAYDASLSPDGSQIVFRGAVTRDIWIMGVDGGQARSLIKPEAGFYLFWPT